MASPERKLRDACRGVDSQLYPPAPPLRRGGGGREYGVQLKAKNCAQMSKYGRNSGKSRISARRRDEQVWAKRATVRHGDGCTVGLKAHLPGCAFAVPRSGLTPLPPLTKGGRRWGALCRRKTICAR